MKLTKVLIVVLIILTITLEVVNIYLSNKVAVDSLQATQLQKKIDQFEDKNVHLRSELLEYTSYEVISSRAATLGFVEPKDFITLYPSRQIVAVKK